MPQDDANQTLVNAFSKPYGETEGAQVFELEFEYENQKAAWWRIASATAEKLGMSIKIQGRGTELCTIQVALLSGDEYPRLLQAMQPELDQWIKENNAHWEAYVRDALENYDLEDLSKGPDQSEGYNRSRGWDYGR